MMQGSGSWAPLVAKKLQDIVAINQLQVTPPPPLHAVWRVLLAYKQPPSCAAPICSIVRACCPIVFTVSLVRDCCSEC